MPATARGRSEEGLDALRAEVGGRLVVVIGLGASGAAAARALDRAGASVRVSESRPGTDVADAATEVIAGGGQVLAGGHAPDHLDGAALVVTSPGVPLGAPIIGWARERDLAIWSELELGARLAARPYVAVTGTNGKTTTTEMIAAMMRAAGSDAVACGNVGYPFSTAALESHDVLVVEASSFQLRFHRTFKPRVSVLLNVAPDHLDWHGGMADYMAAKERIFELQDEDDVHVGNRDDEAAATISSRSSCPVVWFRAAEPGPGEVGYVGDELSARLGEDVGLGRPASDAPAFRADAAAAGAAAWSFGVPTEAVVRAIESFTPLPHRGEVVAEVDGIRFVDDSKATNPHAALAALGALHQVVLIAGGRAKGIDLSPLASATSRLSAVVALGEAQEDLVSLFDRRVPVGRASSIEEAVEMAHELASPGATVLLAPACASQDMFRDYRERGERFAAAARGLRSAAGGSSDA